jgi:hypothetical protein
MRALVPVLTLAAMTGCNEGSLQRLDFGRTAIVLGDFDTVEQLIQEVSLTTNVRAEIHKYDGFTDGPHWEAEADETFERPALQVEDLLRSDAVDALDNFDTTFFSCGMRGVADHIYNGVGEDNHLVDDGTVIENLRATISHGRALYFSDWTYDLLERSYPDAVTWLGDDEILDDAQRGQPGDVTARVVHEGLADAMEVPVGSQIELIFNQGGWAVPLEVSDPSGDVTAAEVLVAGDISYDDPEGGGILEATDVPLVFSLEIGRGRVVYTAFHSEAQITEDARDVLRFELGELSQQ